MRGSGRVKGNWWGKNDIKREKGRRGSGKSKCWYSVEGNEKKRMTESSNGGWFIRKK